MIIAQFLILAFGISLLGFAFIAAIPGAHSPENIRGLPFWIVTVWGPSLAAIILSARNGELLALLGRTVKVSSVPVEAWALVLAPLLLLAVLRPFAPGDGMAIGTGAILATVAFNLFLGPLGEELGWRGLMQEHLNMRMGWLAASLVIGVVWLVWHLPLWTVDSPQAQIPLPLFAAHCMSYAVIIGAAYSISGGSILPAILIHLTVNLASNWAIFAGFREAETWFAASAAPYALLAAAAVWLVYARTGELGLRLSAASG